MENTIFREAHQEDAPRIWKIILQAKEQMYREGKHQWDETYPAMETIDSDIKRGDGYVLCDETGIIAYAAVVFTPEPVYNNIEGQWLSDDPYVVVHRLAVAEEAKHQGIARKYMDAVEKLAAKNGFRSFKIDTNYDNFYMQKLLEKCGFSYCGIVRYEKGERMAYEKAIRTSFL